jgi:hypothetical protein
MKTALRFIHLFVLTAVIAACIPMPTAEPTATASPPYRITMEENPFAPQTGDLGLQIAGANITSVSISERLDLTPPRVVVGVLGSMPSVCNDLRVLVNLPDDNFRIFIEVYSLITPDIQCDNVFQQFEANVLLGTYSSGRYTIWVNDGLVGDFVAY